MKFDVEALRKFAQEVSVAAGMKPEYAEVFVDCMIQSDLRGIRTHGLTKFRGYLKRVELGGSDIKAEPTLERTAPGTIRVDGNNGMGFTTAWKAMNACIEAARENGVACAAVRNATHHGFGGYYVMHAARQGMIALEVCNTPALVAPFGGAKPVLGTNPLSIAIPAGERPMLVLDMATSLVAKGKIALAIKEGRSIPADWALDADGNFTTDPVAANTGTLLPFGGPKGYSIALIIEILCACLAGANTSLQIPRVFEQPEIPSNIGYYMCVVDISKFVDPAEFEARMGMIYDALKACPPSPGSSGVLVPGEIEEGLTRKNLQEGIELNDATVQEFRELSERYHIPLELVER